MQIRLDILPIEQAKLYPFLRQVTDLDFVLFGGTAIALQLGHRQSVDFDFFHEEDISGFQSNLLHLEGLESCHVMQNEHNTLCFQTHNGVKFSFFGQIDWLQYVEKILSNDNILQLADLDSLLVTKLKAICDRAECKDYKDIIAILKTESVDLLHSLNRIELFFGKAIPLGQILKGLTYFEDGDLNLLTKKEKRFLERVAIKAGRNLGKEKK